MVSYGIIDFLPANMKTLGAHIGDVCRFFKSMVGMGFIRITHLSFIKAYLY
jgi:hypothetical protein